ncbi:recombinase family protein [Rhodococcus tukisamuensis]|uniref:Site-specific DNA recombinase n=1 Tax=Rhodococcus tukisamuensis TaxID=168276 RepID=A0A1G6Z6Z8_9NOCA|nr:recombinase family protein [Rhodococcus tukisamuensis]SDD98524.1 Site-specific DNA recombinase [Rhodococcus tukisamuensis]
MTAAEPRIEATADTVVAYLRVGRAERAASGLGLDDQRAVIADYADRKGLTVVGEYVDEDEDLTGLKLFRGSVGARTAFEAVARGDAGGLVVSRVDRLCRPIVDLLRLLGVSRAEGWSVHLVDLDLDTGTPAGRMAADIITRSVSSAQQRTSERTKVGLTAKKERGERVGAAPSLPVEVTRRILVERAGGRTLQAIADGLMSDGIPTARGGSKWFAATIKAILGSDNAADVRRQLDLDS